MSATEVFRAACPFTGCAFAKVAERTEEARDAISKHFAESHSDDRVRDELAWRCVKQYR